MKRLLVSVLASIASLGSTAVLPAAEQIDLRVLYLGNAGTPRAASYESFLTERFLDVDGAGRDGFDPLAAGEYDVVLLDWSQQDVDIMHMDAIGSPLGPREAWTTPTVLLGSAGLLIASPWRTNGAYG